MSTQHANDQPADTVSRGGRAGPGFFIAGAPKSGTTALGQYLHGHLELFVCVPKEPFYFATDLPGMRKVTTGKDYLRLFTGGGRHVRCRGEASTLYLYSTDAARRIRDFNPDARIIVMLRNPVDLVYSFHSQLVYSFFEDQVDFEAAWRLQQQRRHGKCLPPRCPEPRLLQYGDVGLLGAQLDRLFQVFPRQQVHTIVFDDFAANPEQSYRDTLAFLGVSFDGRTDYRVSNRSSTHRFRWLSAAKSRFSRHNPRSEAALRSALRAAGLERLARRVMAKPKRRSPLPARLREQLNEFFAADVERLCQLLARDLKPWTRS